MAARISRIRPSRWMVLATLNTLVVGVLCLYRPGPETNAFAAPKEAAEPFANAVGQRAEMIALLKDIQAQLKEQNALLASGKLQVVVQPRAAEPER